jgi:hypothetical protein
VAYRAHEAEGNRGKAQAHLEIAERLASEIKQLQASAGSPRDDRH